MTERERLKWKQSYTHRLRALSSSKLNPHFTFLIHISKFTIYGDRQWHLPCFPSVEATVFLPAGQHTLGSRVAKGTLCKGNLKKSARRKHLPPLLTWDTLHKGFQMLNKLWCIQTIIPLHMPCPWTFVSPSLLLAASWWQWQRSLGLNIMGLCATIHRRCSRVN